jgi:hypothetical protein
LNRSAIRATNRECGKGKAAERRAFFAEENRYNRNKGTGGLRWNAR